MFFDVNCKNSAKSTIYRLYDEVFELAV